MKHYYIGLDGGGSKTEVLIVDDSHSVINDSFYGPLNPNDTSYEVFINDLLKIIKEALPKDYDTFDICLGISGLKTANIENNVIDAVKQIKGCNTVKAVSDIDISFALANKSEACVAIIGTGNVIFNKRKDSIKKIAGYGPLFDESLSGYDIGRRAIKTILNECENNETPSYLRTQIKEGPIEIVRKSYLEGKKYIASFCPLVFDGIKSNDKKCEEILKVSLYNFLSLLEIVYKENNSKCLDVYLTGGLVNVWDIIKTFLSEDSQKKFKFIVIKTKPVFGAVKIVDSNFQLSNF